MTKKYSMVQPSSKNEVKIKTAEMMKKEEELRQWNEILRALLKICLPSFEEGDQLDDFDIWLKGSQLIEYMERSEEAGNYEEAMQQLQNAPSEQALRNLMSAITVDYNKVSDNQ